MEITRAPVAGGEKQSGGSERPLRELREVLNGIFYVSGLSKGIT
jgi:hypothetical protein